MVLQHAGHQQCVRSKRRLQPWIQGECLMFDDFLCRDFLGKGLRSDWIYFKNKKTWTHQAFIGFSMHAYQIFFINYNSLFSLVIWRALNWFVLFIDSFPNLCSPSGLLESDIEDERMYDPPTSNTTQVPAHVDDKKVNIRLYRYIYWILIF